jgi:hypothetical protein
LPFFPLALAVLRQNAPAYRHFGLENRKYFRCARFWEIGPANCQEVGMQGDYPCFNATYIHEELVEHFLLTPADRAVVNTCRGEANRHGVAVLLKSVQYLGYFPDSLGQAPEAVPNPSWWSRSLSDAEPYRSIGAPMRQQS